MKMNMQQGGTLHRASPFWKKLINEIRKVNGLDHVYFCSSENG